MVSIEQFYEFLDELETTTPPNNIQLQTAQIFCSAVRWAFMVDYRDQWLTDNADFIRAWNLSLRQFDNSSSCRILHAEGWRAIVLNEDEIHFYLYDFFDDLDADGIRRRRAMSCVNPNFCAPCA